MFVCSGSFVKLEFLAFCDKLAVDSMRPVTHTGRWSAVVNDERVRRASALLVNRQTSRAQFLHQASFAVNAAVNHGLRIHPDESDESDSD